MYTIYCHIFPNGKRYIGLTKTTLRRRWQNGCGYYTCPLANRAIEKYGWQNITHETLFECEAVETAEEKEKYFIAYYRTTDPKHGYNILAGGDVSTGVPESLRKKLGNGMRGKKHTPETKARISSAMKGLRKGRNHPLHGKQASQMTVEKMKKSHIERWADDRLRKRMSDAQKVIWSNPEHREKMQRIHKGRTSPNKGKKLSEETKQKLREVNTGKWIGEKSPSSKPVEQYTKDGEFLKRWACAGEATRAIGVERSNIASCCRGKVQTAGGYVWKYEALIIE